MKNLVRAFVVALALTGAVASAHTAKTTTLVASANMHSSVIPMCPPSDPNGCGFGR